MTLWHPMYDAVEIEPGTWVLEAQFVGEYGRVQIRRVGADTVRYRVSFRGELIGWAISLRVACERAHRAFLASHGPQSGPIADWGDRSRRGD